jgi:hypothetical protein
MRLHRRILAAAAGATILAVTPAHADVNLLTNPGFESGHCAPIRASATP